MPKDLLQEHPAAIWLPTESGPGIMVAMETTMAVSDIQKPFLSR
jgi:hypothetical protein